MTDQWPAFLNLSPEFPTMQLSNCVTSLEANENITHKALYCYFTFTVILQDLQNTL